MWSLLKSAVLSLGVLAGGAAVALAQSVSALPPSSPDTPTYSTSKIVPNPGNSKNWQVQRPQSRAEYEADKSQHPYSTSIGPQPGAHSSGKDQHYETTDGDKSPTRHPYTSNIGPRLN